MIKEGLPAPSCSFSTIDTCHIDEHNDALKRIMIFEHQGTEKSQCEDDAVSQMKFSFYVCIWYVFYRADPPFLRISLFFMHLHRPPEHLRPSYRSSEYCHIEYRLPFHPPSERLPRVLDNRPTVYRLNEFLHRLTDYRPTVYRLTACLPTDNQDTDYQPTDDRSTDSRCTDYRPTGYLPIDFRSTDYHPTVQLSTIYQPTYRHTNNWPTDYCSAEHCPPTNQSSTHGHMATRLFPHFSHPPWLCIFLFVMS